MKRFGNLFGALVLVAVLSGCASGRVRQPLYSTGTEAVATLGEPAEKRQNEDGTSTLVFSTQPDGTTCKMIQIDQEDQIVREWDALARNNLKLVKPEMSKEEVHDLLGPHRSERTYPGTNEEEWDWSVRRHATFVVRFSDNKVTFAGLERDYVEGARVWYPYPYVYPYPYWYGRGWYGGRSYRPGGYRSGGHGGGYRHHRH